MPRLRRKLAVATASAASVALVLGLNSAATASAAADDSLPDDLAEAVTFNKMNRHLVAFQRIAEMNEGHRASGTAGYDASADYVAEKAAAAGLSVTRQEFDFIYFEAQRTSLESDGTEYDVEMLEYSPSTDEGGITAETVAVPESDAPGCDPSDYDGIDAEGKIALIQRGECTFAEKQELAAEAGAVAAVIYNNESGPLNGTLGDPDVGAIPTGGLTDEDGAEMVANEGAEATLDLQAEQEERTTENVLAETKTGSRDNVVIAGAHLDSVTEGAGINDNGTGAAGILSIAEELGGDPDINNAVRFAWWGAEESGLIGSTHYVDSLSFDEQLDIALYENFDMIGSPNAGYFVYDGDGDAFDLPGPHGSDVIEQAFVERLEAESGFESEPTEISFRSDYARFFEVGIPFGGLFTGAEGVKTEEQVSKWGGEVGVAYDSCYHQACDNLGNVDHEALQAHGKAAAHVTGQYALSTEDVNGVQPGAAKDKSEVSAQRAETRASSASSESEGHHAVR